MNLKNRGVHDIEGEALIFEILRGAMRLLHARLHMHTNTAREGEGEGEGEREGESQGGRERQFRV